MLPARRVFDPDLEFLRRIVNTGKEQEEQAGGDAAREGEDVR